MSLLCWLWKWRNYMIFRDEEVLVVYKLDFLHKLWLDFDMVFSIRLIMMVRILIPIVFRLLDGNRLRKGGPRLTWIVRVRVLFLTLVVEVRFVTLQGNGFFVLQGTYGHVRLLARNYGLSTRFFALLGIYA